MDIPLANLVQKWLHLDKNEATRSEIERLWAAGETAELERRMRNRIEFGTAGLRGRMEAGFSRMNDLIIIQASQGLCQYVLRTVENAATRGVVVGHDHRHHSEEWAQLTAAAFLKSGVKVYLHRGLVHTPLVPFSVKKLGAACGVMITGRPSHAEIIEPHDKGIAASIRANLSLRLGTSSQSIRLPSADRTDEMGKPTSSLASLCLRSITPIKFVNTSMHGVSHPFVTRAFEVEQQHPDPDFPTVKFPNPEEKGECGASYVVAQDPDADRFAAQNEGETLPDGKWIQFTGDQLGALFASAALDRYKASGKPLERLAMVASTVSSKMIEAMAQTEGFKFAECLTGFKFIGNAALKLDQEGYEVPFGYEEAIGFMFGSDIRDKDGVAATVMFAELVASLQAQGKSASQHLQELYKRNSYFVCSDPPTIQKIFTRLRDYDGASVPATQDDCRVDVTSVRDLTVGYDSSNPPTYKPALPLSSGQMVQFRAESPVDGTRITLTTRTSGTEPKIKYYLEGSGKSEEAVRVLLPKVVDELADEWMEAGKYGLARG
ncbi:phosphoglucomutase first 3 domain-containing protein [Fomitopsis serialis]|uniref:phosphoglucomutase first 3 domain-containing protein n=1 Tax=Fomitopsis serialis TaxID=139415 RepID=UPI0020076ACB|nr:phosphoglucomutase first 3 domain-containing protein [Neoantrodia serialis]KAH9934848.1 phosphoglucomutase first 3 domain-containing protein [Neoantrodia serialis]